MELSRKGSLLNRDKEAKMTPRLLILMVLISSLICTSMIADAKNHSVFIHGILESALFIGHVEIVGYNDSMMTYKIIKTGDTVSRYCGSLPEWDKERIDLNQRRAEKGLDSTYMTGYWPKRGENVLLVLDSINNISLFAHLVHDKYRFWCPRPAGRLGFLCRFLYVRPGQGLEKKDESKATNRKSNYYSCTDGCLLPKSMVLKRRKASF